MRDRIKNAGAVFCLLAMFVAGGGHWAVLQTIAWGRMIVDYSRNASLATAVGKTFDGDHPCPLCTQIDKGRAAEEKGGPQAPPARPAKAPEPMCLPEVVRAESSAFHRLPHEFDRIACPAEWAEAPPTPPPRHATA